MVLPRYAAKRDSNDLELKRVAEQMGWYMVALDTPCDYLGCLKALALWTPIEIKSADGEFTKSQKFFRQDCLVWRMPTMVWRTVGDVIEQTNALRSRR
jgi:hypothetical protein